MKSVPELDRTAEVPSSELDTGQSYRSAPPWATLIGSNTKEIISHAWAMAHHTSMIMPDSSDDETPLYPERARRDHELGENHLHADTIFSDRPVLCDH